MSLVILYCSNCFSSSQLLSLHMSATRNFKRLFEWCWSPSMVWICLSVRWYVLDAETTDLVAIHTDGNEQLSVMRFSVGGWSQVKAVSASVTRWPTCPTIPLCLCRWQPAGCWISWQLYLPVHRLRARTQIQQIREVLGESAPGFFPFPFFPLNMFPGIRWCVSLWRARKKFVIPLSALADTLAVRLSDVSADKNDLMVLTGTFQLHHTPGLVTWQQLHHVQLWRLWDPLLWVLMWLLSCVLQVLCVNSCVFSGDVPNGCNLIRNRSECKDIDWATYTCVLGYHVFG